jgi:hypothetical protein
MARHEICPGTMALAEWHQFIFYPDPVDRMINNLYSTHRQNQVRKVHKQYDSKYVLFIGKGWADKYAFSRPEYRGLPLRIVDHMVAAIIPKCGLEGEPIDVTIDNQTYSTILVN